MHLLCSLCDSSGTQLSQGARTQVAFTEEVEQLGAQRGLGGPGHPGQKRLAQLLWALS